MTDIVATWFVINVNKLILITDGCRNYGNSTKDN